LPIRWVTTIGTIDIHITDEQMTRELNRVLAENLVNTFVIALLLIGLLFLAMHRLFVRPLAQIARALEQTDADGIPTAPLPDFAYRQISLLTDTMRTMVGVIRQARDARQQIEDEMRHTTQELSTILDNSSVGISFVKDRRQIWANRRMAEVFGFSLEEMSGLETRQLFLSEEDYEALGQQAYPQLHAGQRYTVEQLMRHRDGHALWVRISGKAVMPGHPEAGSIWVFEDIRQQKSVEIDLVNARKAAEAANIAKSRFLATMSHEIRTPMNGMLGMAQLLLAANLDERERLDYARTILSSGKALLVLLNDILDLSKVESGKIVLENTDFDLLRQLDETRALFLDAAHRKGVEIHLDPPLAAATRYLGDAHRLRQMLVNLVDNAVKFTERGDVRIAAAELECTDSLCLVEFSVMDSGIGIPEDKLDSLFQPFSQADSSTTRQYGGTGLGLSIVRSLARMMGGEAGVDSTPGVGSRFWFRVRVEKLAADPDTHDAAHSDNAGPPIDTLSGQILVVEDNEINRRVIGNLLGKLGLSSILVEDGQQGVEAVTGGGRFDMVLMDIRMPVLDGREATQRIRQWEAENQRPRLPIVALTADAFEEDRRHCLSIGMDEYLAKPVDLASLQLVLKRYLRPGLPAGSAADLPPPAALASFDAERVQELIRQLMVMLAEHRFDAVGCFRDLQTSVANTTAAAAIHEAGKLMDDLRFDQVSQRLRDFAHAQGWTV